MDDPTALVPQQSFESVLDAAAGGLADGLTADLRGALDDPIVRLLMAADNVEPPHLVAILRRTAERLGLCARPGPTYFSTTKPCCSNSGRALADSR